MVILIQWFWLTPPGQYPTQLMYVDLGAMLEFLGHSTVLRLNTSGDF